MLQVNEYPSFPWSSMIHMVTYPCNCGSQRIMLEGARNMEVYFSLSMVTPLWCWICMVYLLVLVLINCEARNAERKNRTENSILECKKN
jgi:hypothetical protein